MNCNPYRIDDLLCYTGWKTRQQLESLDEREERDFLIKKIQEQMPSHTYSFYAGQSGGWLVHTGAMLSILHANNWASFWRYKDHWGLRHVIAQQLHKKSYGTLDSLKGLSAELLISKACEYYKKNNVVVEVFGVKHHSTIGSLMERKPALIGTHICDNCRYSQKGECKFRFEESFTESMTYLVGKEESRSSSHSLSLSFSVASVVPAKSSSIGGGWTGTWTQGNVTRVTTNEEKITTKLYSMESVYSLAANSAVQIDLWVHVGDVSMPFEMSIRLKSGETRTLSGTYKAVRSFSNYHKATNIPCEK
ncbi:unnamed protein product, partial [Mesorhabditis belari]|uniref:Uncharacterized protein n=1 Tax=Mesorhabditis belari TaxID=2138241 RepID=A0AAF3JBX5_9BILA